MKDNTSGFSTSLLHVHICLHCTAVFRREEVEGRVHTTGLFLCPRCEREGPLNVEIRDMSAGETEDRMPDG